MTIFFLVLLNLVPNLYFNITAIILQSLNTNIVTRIPFLYYNDTKDIMLATIALVATLFVGLSFYIL